MDNTILQTGSFVATGSTINIPLISGVDTMTVYNMTVLSNAQVAATGAQFYWQRGFDQGGTLTTFKSNAANASNLYAYSANDGFTFYDSSVRTPGALETVTSISNATTPVVTNPGANGLSAGNIVRLIGVTGANQFNGLEF